jgi:hypothetical protein
MYGYTNGDGNGNAPTPMHYALVFGVGMGLSMFLRVPLAAGALLYTLGFWIRGQRQTQRLLAQGALQAEAVRLRAFQAAAMPSVANGGPRPPRAADDPVGAGVRVGDATEVSQGVYVRNGHDTIDVGTY